MDRVQDSRKATPDVRGLQALVIGLGVLIVLGTALVIGVVIKRLTLSTGRPAIAAGRASAMAAPFTIALPGGPHAAIAGMAAAGGVVAIWVKSDAGGHVVFVDPHNGALVGKASFAP